MVLNVLMEMSNPSQMKFILENKYTPILVVN